MIGHIRNQYVGKCWLNHLISSLSHIVKQHVKACICHGIANKQNYEAFLLKIRWRVCKAIHQIHHKHHENGLVEFQSDPKIDLDAFQEGLSTKYNSTKENKKTVLDILK